MPTTNPVSQVLVTSGNQSPLAAGSRVTDLNNGQIGIFNLHTGLSVDGSVGADTKDIFLAVGVNRTSGGTADAEDIQKSAGQCIQVRNMRALTFKGRVPEIQKVIEVTGFKTFADTAYGLKIEYRNQSSYLLHGFGSNVSTYNGQAPASTDPLSLYVAPGEVARQIINAINADRRGLVIAAGFSYQITGTVNTAPTADGTASIAVGTETFDVDILDADTVTIVAAKIAAAINADTESIYAASSVGAAVFVFPKESAATGSTTATISVASAGGTAITMNAITAANATISDLDAYITANPDAAIGIRITGVAQARNSSNDINQGYAKSGTDFLVSLPYGFEGDGDIDTITPLQYSEGSGHDLKWEEYLAGGWDGKPGPYRQSNLTGLARQGFEYFISPTANYHQLVLAYDLEANAGWHEYKNNLQTIIAIPEADTTTLANLVTMFDLIFTQFGGMAGDVAANDTEEVTTDTLVPATDGIESLS